MKARYSPIAPIQLLRQLHINDCLGGYLLLLAHDVLDNQEEYAELIGSVRERYRDSFIIMDNSVVELGKPMNLTSVLDAADIVGANCIMTPDVLGSFHKTQVAVDKGAHQLKDCGYPLMRVPQGETLEELILCTDWLRFTLPSGDIKHYWGVPRWVANKLGSRRRIVRYIAMSGEPQIHLLGMSKYFSDDLHCVKMPGVMGIDSANPVVMGMLGLSIEDSAYAHWDRGDYWGENALTNQAIANVGYMHRVCST